MSDEGSDVEKPKEPEPEADGKRIFLSHSNTYEGQAMFKELDNKDKVREEERERTRHKFVGTIRKEERNARDGFQEPPDGFQKFVEFERSETFRQSLLESNIIIYDLMSNDYEEVDYVIKTLKTSPLTENKTLILLSSVMTWVNTPPKFEEEAVEGQDPEEGEEAAEEEESDVGDDYLADKEKPAAEEDEDAEPEVDEAGEPIVVKKPIYFKETDYHLRVPHVNFQHLKTLETVAMSSVNTQPLLRVHVLCSGIRYGNGERIFYDHFQKAWIQNPADLPYIGEGENLVPTIHIIDLARLVRRVVEVDKEHPYVFAIDKTRRPSQKRLIQAISKGIGTD